MDFPTPDHCRLPWEKYVVYLLELLLKLNMQCNTTPPPNILQYFTLMPYILQYIYCIYCAISAIPATTHVNIAERVPLQLFHCCNIHCHAGSRCNIYCNISIYCQAYLLGVLQYIAIAIYFPQGKHCRCWRGWNDGKDVID